MMWLNTDNTVSLDKKIIQAVDYYKKKYGQQLDLCLVHPSLLDKDHPLDIAGLTVRPYRPVLPGHLWIGVEDKP
jgi:hypothetical protein